MRVELVFLGGDLSAPLLHEGRPLAPGARLAVERRRSPWKPGWPHRRAIVGSHPQRADVLLEGEGIAAEHLRIYITEAERKVELRPLEEAATTMLGERRLERLEWLLLHGGEVLQLGPWRFRCDISPESEPASDPKEIDP